MNSHARACIAPLVDLGFTEIEASAYAYLVQHSPATGYRVAQGIGKPVANTYKAIHSLREKGAVIVDGRGRQHCRSVPPAEVFNALEQGRRRKVIEASEALARLEPSDDDDGVYALNSRDQAIERFREMLEQARDVVLADVFPDALAELRGALEATAARGVRVAVQVYAPIDLHGIDVVLHHRAPAAIKRWPGQWLNLSVDGCEYMVAFFGANASQAVWSASPNLSWIYHGGLWAEMMVARLTRAVEEGASPTAIGVMRKRFIPMLARELRGYQRLRRRLVPTPRPPRPPRPPGSRRSTRSPRTSRSPRPAKRRR